MLVQLAHFLRPNADLRSVPVIRIVAIGDDGVEPVIAARNAADENIRGDAATPTAAPAWRKPRRVRR
jgi:hypothetical protein